MLPKPAWATSSRGDSVEPLMTAMQSPRRIASAPSATLWVPVAQADTMHMLWPIAPGLDRDHPRGRVDQAVGDERRGDGPRALALEEVAWLSIISCCPPAPRAEDDADLGRGSRR